VQYNETMALSGWRAALLVGVVACSPYGGGAYHCDRDDQCTGGGTCEPNGLCSFGDPGCTSGRRYGDLSGDLAHTCVGDEPVDAGVDTPVGDGAPDAPAAPFCDAANEPALVGCWQFEGNTTDASGDNNNATVQNTSFGTGKVGMGLTLQASSLVAVADSTSLTPTTLTIEAFVRPTALPTGSARMGVFDNDGQYGLFLVDNGVLCSMSVAVTGPAVAINTWSHIACTYDGTTVRLYLNGAQVATLGGGSPLGAGNTNGSVIGGNSPSGDQLIGTIDQVRVWNVARTAAQVCAASGAPLCP
jgi:hypothetical protein